jgi:peptidoglycan hydrolase-like protein with peptidoglycan-binding domain
MPASHAHSKRSRPERPANGHWGWLTAITVVTVVAVVALGVTLYASHGSDGRASASPTTSPAREVEASVHTGKLHVVSVSPANGATGVPSDATITVQFSVPLKAHSPAPTLNPAVPGAWHVVTPETYMFVASGPLVPSSTETITIPSGGTGVTSTTGKTLAQPTTASFTVADGSTLRLQQLLAQLGYLPVSFAPAGPLTAPQEAAQAQEGSFAWRWSEPSALESQWTEGTPNQITKGAVMAYESDHNLKTDGIPGPAVWSQLLADAAAGTVTTAPYNYVYVTETLPETTTVYSNGSAVYSTKANTGVAGAPTQTGTFPVYERFKVTTMSGTNPDGSKYVDPGIPWVSYFNGGDALHGFVRSSYGFPQSDGCVEMPPANAAVVFPLTPIGTLVTVA